MNIANFLTTIRFFMIPLFVYVFRIEGDAKLYSALIFVIASITDVLDGYLARKYHLITKWGQLMDPLADKLMQITVIILMVVTDIVPTWFVIVLVIKESLMILGSLFLYYKKTYVKANIFGKLNTVVLFMVLTFLLVSPQRNSTAETVVLSISVALSVFAMGTYLYSYFLQQKKFKQYIKRGDTQ